MSKPVASAAPRAIAIGILALCVLSLLRLGAVVVHEPLAGYANQYDMARTSACLGLWPAGPYEARALATPEAPRPALMLTEPEPLACYPSSDVAFAAAGVAVAGLLDAAGFDGQPGLSLRAIGLTKAALWLGILGFVAFALRRHPKAALVHAGFAALVLADPFNTLYLNTLYTETGALLGAWLALAGLHMRALPRVAPRQALIAVAVGCALLGASRVQHLALPFGITLLWWLVLRARATLDAPAASPKFGSTALLLGVALAAVMLQLGTQHRFESIAAANRQNMLFGALLTAADDPERLAARLGLPKACAELAYTTWYRPLGRDLAKQCPQANQPGLGRIAFVLATEPSTLLAFAGRGLAQSTGWRPAYIGELAGGSYTRLGAGPLGLTASLADASAGSSLAAHALFWLLPLFAGVGATIRLWRARSVDSLALDVAAAASSGIVLTVWTSALLGDGYSEFDVTCTWASIRRWRAG